MKPSAARYVLMISVAYRRTTTAFVSPIATTAGVVRRPGVMQPFTSTAARYFAEKQASSTSSSSSSSKTKPKQKKKKRSKAKQRQIHREANERRHRYHKLKRKKSLHPAAKWKRILSACDFWFSRNNLSTDIFLRATLQQHNGYIPISTLLTFPKFHDGRPTTGQRLYVDRRRQTLSSIIRSTTMEQARFATPRKATKAATQQKEEKDIQIKDTERQGR